MDGITIYRVEDSLGLIYSFKPNPQIPISRLSLGWDGNLILEGSNASKIWESKTGNFDGNSELLMKNNGDLVLLVQFLRSWSSETAVSAQYIFN